MESHTKTWIRGCEAVIGQAVIVPERNPGTVAFYWLGAQWGLGPDSTPRPSTGTWQALAGAYLSEVLVQPTRRRLSPVAIPVAAVVAKFNCLLEDFSSFVSYFLSLFHLLCQTRVIGMPGRGMWNRAQRLFHGRHHFHHFHHFVVPHTDQSAQSDDRLTCLVQQLSPQFDQSDRLSQVMSLYKPESG